MPAALKTRTLVMGATGRVGALLQRHWSMTSAPVFYQSRGEGFDLKWDPLKDGPEPLMRFAKAQGGLGAIVAMIGATPSTAGDMSQTAKLAQAVIHAAEQAAVPRVLLASSAAVYPLGADMNEAVTPNPNSPYGQAKLDMEQAVTQSNLEVCCLRVGNVAGADALIGVAAKRTDKVPVKLDQFADGKGPVRSYISPRDLAACLEALIGHTNPLPSVLNCATTPATEMADLLGAAGLDWEWVPASPEKSQTQWITLDCTALAQIAGGDVLAATPYQMITDLKELGVLQ